MTLTEALSRALKIMRRDRRAVEVLCMTTPPRRYRLTPREDHPWGYSLDASDRQDEAWQPWREVGGFRPEEILYEEWAVP